MFGHIQSSYTFGDMRLKNKEKPRSIRHFHIKCDSEQHGICRVTQICIDQGSFWCLYVWQYGDIEKSKECI